jgi:hypothetical protein
MKAHKRLQQSLRDLSTHNIQSVPRSSGLFKPAGKVRLLAGDLSEGFCPGPGYTRRGGKWVKR